MTRETITALLILLMVVLLFGVATYKLKDTAEQDIEQVIKCNDTIILQEYFYNQMVDSIKTWEGFVDSVYFCPGGQKTIGYGHAVRPGDPIRLTRDQAEIILKSDLDINIKAAHRLTGLTGNKLLSIGSFLYNIGIGRFIESQMFKKILSRDPIDQEFDKWVFVRGKYSAHLARARRYQKYLYSLNY